MCCSVLQCVTVLRIFFVSVWPLMIEYVHCGVLQCVAVCLCSLLQRVAVCCSVLQYSAYYLSCVGLLGLRTCVTVYCGV